MVGAQTGNTGEDSATTGVTYLGWGAGTTSGLPLTESIAIGYKAQVTSSYTAVIGNIGTKDAVEVLMSTISVASMTDTGPFYLPTITNGQVLQAGANGLISGAIVPTLASTQVWTGGNDFSSATFRGPVILKAGSNKDIPYVNSSNVLSYDSNMTWDSSNISLNLGGGPEYTSSGINLENSTGGQYFIYSDVSAGGQQNNMAFSYSGTNYGIFGMDGGGTEFHWKNTGTLTNNDMTLDNTGLLSINGYGGGGLYVKYGVSVGSMTGAGLTSCSGASNALTYNGSTNLFGCNTIAGGGSGA